ncbi:MAG: hypothetical protein F4X98_04195 [Gammaproteobacteria bacterium]|nr:hypothetical protein [Gammaproteobacteria bacterium]
MAIKTFPTGLPSTVSLDGLKDDAKTLLKAVGAGEPEALERIKPYFDDASSLTLQRAQLVIAREHGFGSWRKTKAFLEARDEMLASPFPDAERVRQLEHQAEHRFGLARRMAAALVERFRGDQSTRYCSFCFKPQDEAYKFIAGTGVFICDACVRVCSEVVASDKTTGIRGGDEALQCSFCRKRAREVRTFVQSSADNICNECVELCVEIIENGTKTSRPEELDGMIERGRQAVSRGADKGVVMELGRLLLYRMTSLDNPLEVQAYFGEAFDHLDRVIQEHRSRGETGRSPFTAWATLFGGTIQFLKSGGRLSSDQTRRVSDLLDEADERFAEVPGAKIQTAGLRGLLH